jgi:plasmid stabilization system protein ParE
MTYKVVFSAFAKADLFAIYDFIADRAGAEIALRFVERIEAYCLGFATAPERGTRRDELRPRLRTVGFRRRATILFEVQHDERRVVIHGIFYAGRSVEGFEHEAD